MRCRVLLLLGLLVAAAGRAGAQDFTGYCTVIDPPRTGKVVTAGREMRLGRRVQANRRIATQEDSRAAFYLAWGQPKPAAEAGLYLRANTTLQVCPEGAWCRRVHLLGGAVAAHYVAGDGAPMVVSAPSAWVRLESGTLTARVEGESVAFVLAAGRATRFEGAPPAGDPQAVEGGEALKPSPKALEQALGLIGELTTARVASAPAGWLSRAERNDLVPAISAGTPGQPVMMALRVTLGVAEPAVASPVTATAVSPVTTPRGVSSVAGLTTPGTQVQSLLTSGNPASVVVGARLGRTRIVGNPGTTGGGSGVRINPEVTSGLTGRR